MTQETSTVEQSGTKRAPALFGEFLLTRFFLELRYSYFARGGLNPRRAG